MIYRVSYQLLAFLRTGFGLVGHVHHYNVYMKSDLKTRNSEQGKRDPRWQHCKFDMLVYFLGE